MNNNAYKTALMFLGIIFFAIAFRIFHTDRDLFVRDGSQQVANTHCAPAETC